ncbi:MAG: FprA family A-type flavoprotein [Clostridia bacterium]|nr:FprA family A-type flavoprotein [Clostridia bacterium]
MINKITEDLVYVGVYDKDVKIFESQYPLENGVSYNSYVLFDEKTVLFDTSDVRVSKQYFENLKEALGDKKPDYIVVSHMEPDHSANLKIVLDMYKDMKIIANKRTIPMIENFTQMSVADRVIEVGEGSEINIGKHTLKFILAPMVHWPEVMMTYDMYDKTLFSADAFGRFGNMNQDDDENFDEARRYYCNIVGKYGAQVLTVLKKAAALDIKRICPLHSSILDKKIGAFIEKYSLWASYTPEEKDKVTVCYASIHGNTKKVAETIVKEALGDKAELYDLTTCDLSAAVAGTFKNGKLLLMCSTYDAGMFTPMKNFLARLNAKGICNREVAIIENGSWAPAAGKLIKAEMESMKNMTVIDEVITIKSTANKETEEKIKELCSKF